MKKLLIALSLLVLAGNAHALPRYASNRLTCAKVQDVVRQHGAVVLSYPSKQLKGHLLYDTYVASRAFCKPGEVLRSATVPSKDREFCPVHQCKPTDQQHRSSSGRDQPNRR